ncbi:MFS transporter [Ruicaihuangia caeni]|uniref:MFS transporter n=1 Tax=Ruicaihuangia caeni TaxID=3042517 RepID=UPI00338FDB85
MTDSSAHAAPGHSDRAKWEAFAVCVTVAALTILDISKINVGIPPIEASLNGGPTELQLIVAGYALAFGLLLVPAGRLGDLRSRKAMFIIGLSAFTFASLWCALAPNIEMLVVGRLLQGVAAGIQMPQVLGLIQQLFVGPERGRAFGVFGAIIGISTAIGPTLGGVLIAAGGPENGWRLLFWMNVPLGVLALLLAIKLLPAVQLKPQGDRSLDLVGIGLLGATVFCLMLPFVLTTGGPSDDPARWWWLVGFAVFGSLFTYWELAYRRRGKSPVIDFRLFRLATFRNGTLIATAYFSAMPASFLLTVLYVQQGLGFSPVIAGMVSIPFALTSAFTSWWSGRRVEQYGPKLVAVGVAGVFVGFSIVVIAGVLVPHDLVPWAIACGMTLGGLGAGCVISPNQTITLSQVPVVQGGVAGSVGQVGQRVGTAIGVAVAASAFYAVLAGTGADAAGFRSAYASGMAAALGILLVAAVFAIADVRILRRDRPIA